LTVERQDQKIAELKSEVRDLHCGAILAVEYVEALQAQNAYLRQHVRKSIGNVDRLPLPATPVYVAAVRKALRLAASPNEQEVLMHVTERPVTERLVVVRPEIAGAWLQILEQNRPDPGDTIAAEQDALTDRLTAAIRGGDPIDLSEPRSTEAAAHDGEDPTVAGYLIGIARDKFLVGDLGDWRQFIALGALAVEIEATLAPA
jgi:hypothetical protein